MSQVFGMDAQQVAQTVNLPNGTETQVAITNFLNPPYGNCKVSIQADLSVLMGAAGVGLQLRIRRNPTGENAVVNAGAIILVTASALCQVSLQAADSVPDGRPVQYSVTATVSGGAAAGTAQVGCAIAAVLISG